MADGVSDTAQWEDQLAGVALGGPSVHRKRASTFGDPSHLHKRSSSLVSDLTIDGILSDVDCCFKCPRVLERFCPSPDALDSPTGKSALQPPSTPSTCGSRPAALQQQPDNNTAGALPPSPVLRCAAPGQQQQQQQQQPPWQWHPPRLARRSCPGAFGIASMRSPAAAEGAAMAAMHGMPSPASPGAVGGTLNILPCNPAAAAAAAATAAAASPPTLQLNSLMLVASQLVNTGNGSGSAEAGAPGSSSSPLLPATQASLQATTAGVMAAELTAVARQAVPAAPGLQPHAAASSDAAAAAAAAEAGSLCQQQPQQLALPSWLRSGSAGLAASAAICRASLLSTTAALARLSQQQQQAAAAGNAPQQEQQQQQAPAILKEQLQAAAALRAPVPLPRPSMLQQVAPQLAAGAVALGVPVAGNIVVGTPVHPQQQQQQQNVTGVLFDFKAAGACGAGQTRVGSLRLPAAACGEAQQMQQGSMQCDDASSCCSTPRSGTAAAALPSEDVQQVAAAAARLLLSSSSGSRRRRCCWELDAEAMDEEQCGNEMETDGESPAVASAAAAAGAALAEAAVADSSCRQAACPQQLALAADAAACAVVVLVDVAAKRSSSGKDAPQLAGLPDVGLAGALLSAECCGESP
uniref:Uncharacterized protein n=1 Tax=Tetradesmus obliquus TaxID=3088 RepID=A0A383WF16_TETOB|eukprot:jgi/Sobl393_1/6574/SZX76011.1